MSDKPQHSFGDPSDVSRETSAAPETADASDAVVMLNEIMDRAASKVPGPSEEGAQEEDVQPEAPAPQEETAPPAPPEKDKPSSFYIYLVILFGAAFLMLLLAYFVQQRNNATVQDDLRSITASRQELLEDIQRLEEENEALQKEKQELEEKLTEEAARAAVAEGSQQQYQEDYLWMVSQYDHANLLLCLERFRDQGDYLMMGVTVEDADVMFNRLHPQHPSDDYLSPDHERRYLALREELFEESGFMVMEQRTGSDGSVCELPHIGENIFDEELILTAKDLYSVFREYAIDPDYAVMLIIREFQPGSENVERLYSGAFQQSTVDWFEQIEADVSLVESSDGKLIARAAGESSGERAE